MDGLTNAVINVGLPGTYTQLEYLKTAYNPNAPSTAGGAFVDTGMSVISFDEQLTLVLRRSSSMYGDSGSQFGFMRALGQTFLQEFCCFGGYMYWNGSQIGRVSISTTYSTILVVNDSNHRVTYKYGNNSVTTVGTVTDPAATYATNSHIFLFGVNRSDNNDFAYYNSAVCIYSYKRENLSTGAVVQDMVPCSRNSDSVLGFYDLVKREFHPAVNTSYSTITAPTNL